MQTATKQLWASVAAAIVGSVCCVGPLVLLMLGISGAWIGQLTALEPYRPIFIGVSAIFMVLAFRQLYIVPVLCDPCERFFHHYGTSTASHLLYRQGCALQGRSHGETGDERQEEQRQRMND